MASSTFRRRMPVQSSNSFSDELEGSGSGRLEATSSVVTGAKMGPGDDLLPLLERSHPRQPLVSIPFRHFALATVTLPLISFLFCIGYSYLYNFKRSTATHCNVWNFAPSISSSISVFKPQNYVWRMGLSLHSAPRLLLAYMYYHYYRQGLRGRYRGLAQVALGLNVLENLSLLLLSFAASKEDFLLHKLCFIGFIAGSSAYLTCSYVILSSLWWAARSPWERTSLKWKKTILAVNLSTIALALYFYHRHNTYCEPGVYSFFSLCEYVIVLSNMAYHFTSYFDFHYRVITV